MNNHILIWYKTIRNKMKEVISLQFIRSKHNLADLLTKGLSKAAVFETSRGIGLKPIYWSPEWTSSIMAIPWLRFKGKRSLRWDLGALFFGLYLHPISMVWYSIMTVRLSITLNRSKAESSARYDFVIHILRGSILVIIVVRPRLWD